MLIGHQLRLDELGSGADAPSGLLMLPTLQWVFHTLAVDVMNTLFLSLPSANKSSLHS
jgi:hypothetical protein